MAVHFQLNIKAHQILEATKIVQNELRAYCVTLN